MDNTVRIIGLGSPVQGDTLGMQLVAQLRDEKRWQSRGEFEWLILERPGAALLHYFEGVETVCLVDALKSSVHEGVIRIAPEALLSEKGGLSSHQFGVAEALQLATALQCLPPRLLIYGIAGESVSSDLLGAMLADDLAA